MTKQLYLALMIVTIYINPKISAQCPSGNNNFLGTTNNEWTTASNWSEGCVPVSPIIGFISIEANCTLSGSASYTFNASSTFQIKSGVTFTNNSSGIWTMNGSSFGSGIYAGNVILGGPVKPGYVTPPTGSIGTVTHGGQTYTTKLMPDGKWWMAENLNIGIMITGATTMTNNSIVEKYCYNNNSSNCTIYGGIYQWHEMMQYSTTEGIQGICPTGWHLPTNAEWNTLETALPSPDKGSRLAGNGSLWTDNALDMSAHFSTSGFAALPSGFRYTDGAFYRQSRDAFFWSSTEFGSSNAWFRELYYDDTVVGQYYDGKANGFSVRCVQN